MKTILVPTDFTPLAEGALGVAVDLARTYGADILLVHYLPYSIASASTAEGAMAMSSYFGEQEDEAESALQRLIENPAYQGVSITPVATRNAGGLYAAMTQPVPNQVGVTPAGPAVRDRPERRPDLIVLGTHGTLGWDEWLFGSNAEHIVRAALCPVLVIKEAVAHFAPTNAVAAIDVNDILKQQWPPYPFGANGDTLKQFLYVSTPNDPLAPEGVHAWMDELARQKGIADYELLIRPARSVETGILNFADEWKVDLIVLFTHGHTGLRHLLEGSVAEDVLNHAPVPVLILQLNG